jgi:hypothetical protein
VLKKVATKAFDLLSVFQNNLINITAVSTKSRQQKTALDAVFKAKIITN